MLKKIMISAGLATIIATSAMAQSYQPEVGSGNITPKKEYSNGMLRSGENAFAFERSTSHHRIHHDHNLDRD
jgi:hypothetical protein